MQISVTQLMLGTYCRIQHGLCYLCVVGADVKLAGDVDQPLLGCFEVREANTPRAVDNIDQVIYSCAAAYTHTNTHSDNRQLENTN